MQQAQEDERKRTEYSKVKQTAEEKRRRFIKEGLLQLPG